MKDLITSVLNGDHRSAREHAERLLEAGTPRQTIVVDGLAAAMLELDTKCSIDDFDLLQIMLAGRCVLQVVDLLYGSGEMTHTWSKGVATLGTIEGDVHDLGKNIVKAIFTGAGYQVVDLGINVSPRKFVESAIESQADVILISNLLTTSLRNIRLVRTFLPEGSNILVVAGGAAVEGVSAADLNVDYATANVFDGLRFCDSKVGPS